MNILVTGSAGFIAQDLIPRLKALGHGIIGVDLKAESLSDRPFQADLREWPFDEALDFDLCIHLASSVGGFLHNARQKGLVDYELDLLSSVLKLCESKQCRRIIYASTILVYECGGDFSHGPLHETRQMTQYAQAKAQGENFIQDHFDQFVILRPTNVFGKAQAIKTPGSPGTSHVIPELLHKIDASETLEVLGDGKQTRNFIHVSDVSSFIERILARPERGWYNLRSQIQLSISELAKKLMILRNQDKKIVYRPEFLQYEPAPVRLFKMDEVATLGWECRVTDLAQGLIF